MTASFAARFAHRRKSVRLLAAVGLVGSGLILLVPASGRASADDTSSAVTVSGSGDFSSLKVTVGQTVHLADQVVHVTWSGGTPTTPSSLNYATNYLQIMQCWGDASTGPTPQQCEFGEKYIATAAPVQGGRTQERVLVTSPRDPLEPRLTEEEPIPFDAVDGTSYSGSDVTKEFDDQSTNEIPYGRTYPDGTGEVFFNTESARTSPGLGCGALTAGQSTADPCWLVVVPRGSTETDGSPASAQVCHCLVSSPLSATNWAHRIAIKLQFDPIVSSCSQGGAEDQTAGQESVAGAVNSWQSALCLGSGLNLSYTQAEDEIARRQLTTDTPGLSFLTDPIPADQTDPYRPIVYAPVAVSGLSFVVNVDQQTSAAASASLKALNGKRINDFNLTPRLVAKILSDSYKCSLSCLDPPLASNPQDITHDPDFLRYNSRFAGLNINLSAVIEPLELMDTITNLWNWIDADPQARAFLDGAPDPWGMTVNPAFKKLQLPLDGLPKYDQFCFIATVPTLTTTTPICALNLSPYANDMNHVGRGVAQGNTQATGPQPPPPGSTAITFKGDGQQADGAFAVMGVADTATAARYSLVTASLCRPTSDTGNLSAPADLSSCVAPTSSAMLSAVAAMKPSGIPGVLKADPSHYPVDAYPLTQITYAAAKPADLTTQEGADFSAFLRYADGVGQTSGIAQGNLPPGYAPLPNALRAQGLAAADVIERQAGSGVLDSTDIASPSASITPSASSTASASPAVGKASASTATPAAVAVAPASVGAASPLSSPSASATHSVASVPPTVDSPNVRPAATIATPANHVGPVRYVVVMVLVLGGLVLGAGPFTPSLVGLFRGRSAP